VAVLFFDTSALVRRYDPNEPGSHRVLALCRQSSGHEILVARITLVEVGAALNRKLREGRFGEARRDQLWRLFRTHCRQRYVVTALDAPTFQRAERLLFRYRLRGYDAVQLAAALEARPAAVDPGADFRFCTADRAQAQAAEREGLAVELIN
jgi:predicted nucleic acid-binding protein